MATPLIAPDLQATLRKAYEEARRLRHEYVTLEHLLFALTEDPRASRALTANGVSLKRLRARVAEFLAASFSSVGDDDGDF